MNLENTMAQAAMTASQYFKAAIATIDEKFGEGYAKQHPELIGAIMQTSAADYHTMVMQDALCDLRSELGSIAISIDNK